MDAGKDGKLLHAYIISGGTAAARESRALALAKRAVCSSDGARPCGRCAHCVKAEKGIHPDIIFVDKHSDKAEMTIDILRGVRGDAFVLPNEAASKVYVIRGADMMNAASQNAMLKVFEEPPDFTVFILLAENPEKLLPTVRSRCAAVSVAPEAETSAGEDAETFARLAESGDRLGLLKFTVSLDKMEKEDFAAFLPRVKRSAVARIRAGGDRERLMRLINAAEEAEKCLAVNVGRVHITGMLLARLV